MNMHRFHTHVKELFLKYQCNIQHVHGGNDNDSSRALERVFEVFKVVENFIDRD